MSWARIDDAFAWHPKVLQAGNSAVGCWIRCLVHCCASKTDGFVAEAVARAIGSPDDIQALIDSGLWNRVNAGDAVTVSGRRDTARRRLPDVTLRAPAAGFVIPDFLHFHRSRSECAGPDAGGDDDDAAPTRAHGAVRTAPSARRPVPSQPVPTSTPPSLPSPPRSGPSGPARPRPVGAPEGGREVPAPQGGAEGEGGDDEALDDLDAVLVSFGWHRKQGTAARRRQVARLAADGLDIDAVVALNARAEAEGKNPPGLLTTWIDRGTWRDVLAEGVTAAKAEAAKQRPKDDTVLEGIYGARSTP